VRFSTYESTLPTWHALDSGVWPHPRRRNTPPLRVTAACGSNPTAGHSLGGTIALMLGHRLQDVPGLMCDGRSPKFRKGLLPRGRGVILSAATLRCTGNILSPAPCKFVLSPSVRVGIDVCRM
jgi:pimeloyl-ACP methyl ester carboxylesterase